MASRQNESYPVLQLAICAGDMELSNACCVPQEKQCPLQGEGSEPPASCACYSWFLPLSVLLPASCSHLYCKILGKYCNMFSQLPLVPATLGILLPALFSTAFRPFSPGLPPSCLTLLYHSYDTFSNGKMCLTLFLCVSVILDHSSTLVNKNAKKTLTKIQHLEQPPGQQLIRRVFDNLDFHQSLNNGCKLTKAQHIIFCSTVCSISLPRTGHYLFKIIILKKMTS